MVGSRVGGEHPTRSKPASSAACLACWVRWGIEEVAVIIRLEYCIRIVKSLLSGLEQWSELKAAAATPGGRWRVTGVLGSATAMVIAELAKEIDRAFLVVVATSDEAQELADDFEGWCGHWGIQRSVHAYLAPDEVERALPVMAADALMDRLEVIRSVKEEGPRCVVVTTIEAMVAHLPDPVWWEQEGLGLRRGSTCSPASVKQWAEAHGYRRVSMVEGPGEWTQRGGVMDIFSWSDRAPLRLEFEGDELISLRHFHLTHQRSAGEVDFGWCVPALQGSGPCGLQRYFPEASCLVTYEQEVKASYSKGWSSVAMAISPRPDESVPSHEPGIHWMVQPTEHLKGNLEAVERSADRWRSEGWRVWGVCRNQGERDRLIEVLGERKIMAGLPMDTPLITLSRGFIWPALKWVVLLDHELFARYKTRAPKTTFRGRALTDVSELRPQDVVVHRQYGIGRYLGASRLFVEGAWRDFMTIVYAGEDKLHVPFERFSVVQKYVGTGQGPVLNALGTAGWERTKARVKERTRQMAQELIKLYATRQAQPGFGFPEDSDWQYEFEAAFSYQETPDQREATDRIKREMEQPQAMDHLLCGDVGYGKTEVAMRAAFKAAVAKKQVAVLAPTTVLVEQHYQTFRDRMADYPITLAMLSRFQKPSDQRRVIEEIRAGQIDIVIGTHRLLSKDLAFADVGLLIVDEEQRFGVAHKERLKQMSRHVDVLTLTATPIPRTLQFALSGLRSLSMIETPPEGRLPVRTYVLGYEDRVVREAIQREMARGGQVFYVHNRIEQLEGVIVRLKSLIPGIHVIMVHGQLPAMTLEQRMREFVGGGAHVLLSTTIIEAGLDLPNVNTLIVERSDRFGLAEMYQLRGRVGRARRQAYAYFSYDASLSLTPVARERLQAIAACQGLGGGMRIAMKDLELRGAGNLLGAEQHGQVAAVGFELYCQLLAEAVAEMKGEPSEVEGDPEISLAVDAYISDEYAGDDVQKMRMYQQIVGMRSAHEVEAMKREWTDRFGRMPPEVEHLFDIFEVKLLAKASRVNVVKGGVSGDIVVQGAGEREWVIHASSAWSERFGAVKRLLEGLALKSAVEIG